MTVSTSIVPTASASSVEVNSGGNPAVVAAAPASALREVRGVISGRQRVVDGHMVTGFDVTVSDQSGSVTVRVPLSVYDHLSHLGLRMGAAMSVLGRVDDGRVLAVVMTGLVPPSQVADHLAARDGSDPLARLGW